MFPFLIVLTLFISLIYSTLAVSAPDTPRLMLSRLYQVDQHSHFQVQRYWVSEKLDGVRAYWNGRALVTRAGNVIHAPVWFTAPFPAQALDGELWIQRGAFARVSGIVRKHQPDDREWQQVKYMIFDLPDEVTPFTQRLAALTNLIDSVPAPWLKVIPQTQFESRDELDLHLQQTVATGGEGLMLHHENALYQPGRTDSLLKLKINQDAEARVIGYVPGKGKFENQLGALIVQTQDGKTFKIGTGFSHDERKNPPAKGTWVTYQYNGYTKNGLPRFARFIRERDDY
ncbi:DNA ligase [Oleiphilus messinensis]|uniref:DNA ligase n=1 Tax=Oleiphilus messinensis TaxID=141451 RepID=A0A1Y0IGB8_9GAMM|nr:DNA ligase [Oleiphilus messinensis]ARU59541.1 DNA ligase [Oleiphilus messinensis]